MNGQIYLGLRCLYYHKYPVSHSNVYGIHSKKIVNIVNPLYTDTRYNDKIFVIMTI